MEIEMGNVYPFPEGGNAGRDAGMICPYRKTPSCLYYFTILGAAIMFYHLHATRNSLSCLFLLKKL